MGTVGGDSAPPFILKHLNVEVTRPGRVLAENAYSSRAIRAHLRARSPERSPDAQAGE